MDVLNVEKDSQLAAKHNSGILQISGNSNSLKIQQWKNGTIKINGDNTCIFLGGELEQKLEEHISGNDLLYQIIEVVELLIILMIFYVIFNNIN
ncbi:hypothetical protein ACLKA6_006706 [Drosophila palustris]